MLDHAHDISCGDVICAVTMIGVFDTSDCGWCI